ncbi:formate dehydrogenase accessory protein FdhE [Bacillus sp. H-16]|uniref:formate dehydrogenase accessory protein FdhE domain-containing protein n=1 Tax=Alteribacter salitolerans TaxID=2912333 RepID=UPI0019650000|nr:formate dehydrogenase accessory protein FdhE [Alteribacter salitolerans]
MDPSVVSKEYTELQQLLTDVQKRQKAILAKEWRSEVKAESIDKEFPIIPQLEETPMTIPAYAFSLESTIEAVKTYSAEFADDLDRCKKLLGDETVLRWLKEALRYNTNYFQTFAEEHRISAWFPHYIAEQALRPFLQLIAERSQSFADEMNVGGACPCCAEPVRLKKGDMFLCPRCEALWKVKRKACAHCGEEESSAVYRVTVQEEKHSELEVCDSCKNYVKVIIDVTENNAAMLDLLTLHLDYIAQEEGYGEV